MGRRPHWAGISNLLGNAITHGSDSEPITVVLSGQEQDVVATVHNTGNPIPGDTISHIFDPLRRSASSSTSKGKGSGLGLGLYIAREIIQAHDGTIDVASSEQEGTVFRIQLPRNASAQRSEANGIV